MISGLQVPFRWSWAIGSYTSSRFPTSTSSGDRCATTSTESCLDAFEGAGDWVCAEGFCAEAVAWTRSRAKRKSIGTRERDLVCAERSIDDETITWEATLLQLRNPKGYRRSKMPAAPMPPPMHMVTMP